MSLIGLLTATEKQVPLGRLHIRPIQWHLKRHWRVPESLEKEIPVPRSLQQHLRWWTKETNVLLGQPLHPLRHAIQIFTDVSKEGWGAHLGDFTASGTWSVPENHLHVNFLALKAVLLALKRFQHLVQGKVFLVVLVQSETCCSEGKTHPRPSECDCGQVVLTRPNHSDGMVS